MKLHVSCLSERAPSLQTSPLQVEALAATLSCLRDLFPSTPASASRGRIIRCCFSLFLTQIQMRIFEFWGHTKSHWWVWSVAETSACIHFNLLISASSSWFINHTKSEVFFKFPVHIKHELGVCSTLNTVCFFSTLGSVWSHREAQKPHPLSKASVYAWSQDEGGCLPLSWLPEVNQSDESLLEGELKGLQQAQSKEEGLFLNCDSCKTALVESQNKNVETSHRGSLYLVQPQ